MRQQNGQNEGKKTYDDIPFDKRRKLISLINDQRWTIKSAARLTGIKLCTAKYILYQYRKSGKISLRRRYESPLKSSNEIPPQQTLNYVFVPYPVYIYCFNPEEAVFFNRTASRNQTD